MLQGIEIVFEDKERMMRHLKKKSYEENTKVFLEKHGHYFHEMAEHVKAAEKKEVAAAEIGECFVRAVKHTFTNKKGKVESRIQVDLNFFMIYYIFPSILTLCQEDAKVIADALCAVWGKSFKESDIKYTDYDKLYNSFREKILGIF